MDVTDLLETKALKHIAEEFEYDTKTVVGWLRASMVDALEFEIVSSLDGPMLWGEGKFEVRRDLETGRWRAFDKE